MTKSRPQSSDEGLFSGPGESRRLARSVDWRSNGVGAVESWPTELKTAVRICLEAESPMTVWVGPDLRMIHNDAYLALLGSRSSPAMGLPLADVWPDAPEEVYAQYHEVFEEGRALRYKEASFPVKRGGYTEVAHFVYSLTPLRDVDGEVIGVFNVAEDITAKIRARDESEARYRSLFNSIDEGFCIIRVDFEGGEAIDYTFLETNAAFEEQAGLEEPVGRSMRELVPKHEEHWFDIFGRIARTGESVRFQESAGALGRFYDVNAFRIGAPEKCQVAVLFKDITDQKRAEQRLREANHRKDEYMAMLGHELRNPLAAIQHASEIIRLSPRDPSNIERAVDILGRQSRHMGRLIDGLLEASRLLRGKIELESDIVDLRTVVEEVLTDRSHSAAAAGLEIKKELPEAPVLAQADRARMRQVVDNLVGNAVKFTPSNGTVSATVRESDDHAMIRVRDTGVGIAPEHRPKIFEPFHQQEQDVARDAGGLGLGLAVAKELVELHDGAIEAYSDGRGEGAEFVVRLPLAPEA
ncbi:MAG: PAS domain-containing sensor histidine kinase [Persicimonas sp.]